MPNLPNFARIRIPLEKSTFQTLFYTFSYWLLPHKSSIPTATYKSFNKEAGKRCCNIKSLTYHLFEKTKISTNVHICIGD